MKDDLKTQLKTIFEGLNLDEASIDKVVQLFNENVKIKADAQTEVALQKQDDIFSEQLKSFIEQLDAKHANQMQQIVESLEHNYVKKLKMLSEKYDNKYKAAFIKFKNDSVSTTAAFLDMYLKKMIPEDTIVESIKLKKQENLINGLRKLLAVDKASESAVIKEGIIEAKKTINESRSEIEELKAANKALVQKLADQQRDILLEQKLNTVAPNKRETLYKIYKDKSIEQINESFDYSSKIMDKQAKQAKQAKVNAILENKSKNGEFIKQTVKTDAVINESLNNYNNPTDMMDSYLAELEK